MEYKVSKISDKEVRKIHFKFTPHGWTTVTLEDMTKRRGELIITSDWGTWSYIWSGIPEEKNLSQFLISAENEYIADKLTTGESHSEFDTDATKKRIKEFIEEKLDGKAPGSRSNLPDTLGKEESKSYLFDLLEECQWECGEDIWIHTMPEDLYIFLDHEPWWFIEKGPSNEYKALVNILLPALKEHLKGKE